MRHINLDENIKEEGSYFENDTVIAVRSSNLKDNVLVGSFVIIPKSQVGTPFELSEKEILDTLEMMKIIKEYLEKEYQPDGYNIGWNVGEAGGQNVAHAHLHILPRYADETHAGKGIRHWLKQSDNIRKSLKEDKE